MIIGLFLAIRVLSIRTAFSVDGSLVVVVVLVVVDVVVESGATVVSVHE